MTITLPTPPASARSISVVPMSMAAARSIHAASMEAASMDPSAPMEIVSMDFVSIDFVSMDIVSMDPSASMERVSMDAAAMHAPVGSGSTRTMIALLSLVPAPRTDVPLPAGARIPLQSPTAAPVRAPR